MKYRIGELITGCMKSTLKNIGYGLSRFPCLTWGDNLAIRFILVKNTLMRCCEDINRNLIDLSHKKIFDDIINMSSSKADLRSKKKRVQTQARPIDAIREMMEDLNLQISDLTHIIKKQDEEIRSLKSKWNARESIEREERERKEREADKSWFWASRSSE